MVLARINDVKKELQEEARNLGLYYQDVKNNKSFDPNQFLAIQYWEKICDGGSISREEACIMYERLLNIDHGYRSQDSKKWSFAHPNQVFNFDELHLRCGMRDEKGPWYEVMQRKFKDKDKMYFKKLMDEGVDLNLPPKIIIDTIHQVKGGEADNVVLASKCNFPSHFDKKNLDEKVKELRVWYTGVTRCKHTLYLLNIDHGYRSQDSKKWSFAHPNQVFNFDELHLRCGMRDEKGSWNQVFKRKFKDKDKQYFNKLMREGVDLTQPPKIIIDTIHQVKGGEADNVVLASKCNFPSHYEKKNLTEKVKELRVWYTGVTRCKQNLHLLGTNHQYNFPLGKYFKLYEANYV